MLDREIKLLIQAQLKGGRDIAAITKSIGDLEKAIDSQAEAAKRGESSYEGLKAASAGLKTVQEELVGRSSVLKHFEALTKQIDKQSEAVERAKKKLAAFEAKVGTDRTDKQDDQVRKLTKSQQAASASLDQYQRSLAIVDAALREAGVDTKSLGDAQRQVSDQHLAAAVAQNRISNELLAYNDTVTKARAAIAAKAEADRKAAKDADLFAAAENRAAEAARARAAGLREAVDLNIKRQGQRVADSASASEDAAVAKRQQEAIERAKQLAALRTDIEQRSAQGVRDTGLRKTADDAEAAARQFTTLASASTDLRPRIVTLREALDGIVNPSAKVRQTLSGVEGQIKELSDTIAGSKGPIKDYSDQFKKLEAAQKAVQTQAGLIDSYRNQTEALRAASTATVAARAEVERYAAAVRQGGDAGAAFVRPLAEAQAKLRLASLAMREQVSATRDINQALQQAGININNLANAEQRLIGATQATTAAMKQLNGAVEQNGHAVTRTAKGFSLFRDEGRTTLSIAQRIRGEILALITAYVGVQAAITLATDSLKVFTKIQALQGSLGFALGKKSDAPEVAAEIAYLKEQTDRLGISFEHAGKGFASFSASARLSGATAEETRFIFEGLSEVGRVISATPDELGRLFNAMGQIFNKGKIQAEELIQQMAEKLPGAFARSQQALKHLFPDLIKALKEGKVGAENLVLIVKNFRDAVQEQLPKSIKSLDAEQQRFNNSVLFFKFQIADAGFADAYVALLKQITAVKSENSEKLAKTISDFLSMLVRGVGNLVKYREELGLLALILGSILSAKLVSTLAAGLFSMAAASGGAAFGMTATALAARTLALEAAAAAGGVTLLTRALVGLGTVFAVLARLTGLVLTLAAAFVYLTNKFPLLGIAATQSFEEIAAAARFMDAELVTGIKNSFKNMLNVATYSGRKLIAVFSNIFRAIGAEDLANIAVKIHDALTFETSPTAAPGVNAAILKEALDAIKKKAQDAAKAVGAVGSFKVLDVPGAPSVTPFPGVRPGKPEKDDGKAKKERENEIASIQKAIDALNVSALKKQGESLDSLLAAVDLQYKELGERIVKLGGDAGKGFAKEFAVGILSLKVEITKDFNDKILKEQEALQERLNQVSATAGRKDKDDLQSRLDAIELSYKKHYAEIAKGRERLLQLREGRTPDKQSQLADAAAEEQKRQLDGDLLKMKNLETIKVLVEQLAKQEAIVNDLLHAREIALKRIQEQVIAGTITAAQGDAASIATIAQMQPGLATALDTAKEFALANAAAFDPAKLQEFLLKLDQAKNSSAALGASFDRVGQIIDKGIGAGIDNTFNALYESLGALIQRTGTWGDVFQSVGRGILGMIAQILKEIALQIIKTQILIALEVIKASFGGGLIPGGVGAVPYARGGVVGRKGSSMRTVDPQWFAAAPRYQAGGIVGVAPGEYPSILHKNEEVLSASNPRNIVNGGMAGSNAPQSQRFVLVDDRSRVAEAMAGAEGEQVTLLHLRRNIPTLRQLFKA